MTEMKNVMSNDCFSLWQHQDVYTCNALLIKKHSLQIFVYEEIILRSPCLKMALKILSASQTMKMKQVYSD